MNSNIPILVAIFFGPVSALLVSRVLDRLRDKSKARLNLYYTVMSHRAPATWLHPESLRALNNIDIVFSKRKDAPVREAWATVIKHAYTKRPDWNTEQEGARAWDARLLDLRVDLYQRLGTSVGRDLSLDYIKTHMYYPEYHVNAELEWLQIRTQLSKILVDDGLKVIVRDQGGAPAPGAQ